MKKNQQGFSVVESLLILVVVGIIGFVGWYVWQAKNKTNKSPDTANQISTPAEPIFNKLPSGWLEYKSDENGLRLGYPSEWGALDKTTLHTPDYQDNTKNLQGRLIVMLSKKDGFTVVARKYGATIKPSSDGKSWIVSEENPANVDNYKVGNTYKTKEQKVNGGTVIDLSFDDEDCTQTQWLLELKNSYTVVTIPELCAGFNGTERTAVSDTNKQRYAKLITDFLSTITVY